MITSESVVKIATALRDAQAEMPAIHMDAVNPFYKSKYATLGAIIQGSRAVIAKFGLAISQWPTSRPGEIGVTTMLLHVSGEWMQDSAFVSSGVGAKNPAQEAGIAISYLRRYAWAAILGIYTDEDTDGEGIGSGPKVESGEKHLDAIVETLIAEKLFANPFEAKNALKKSKILSLASDGTSVKNVVWWAKKYKDGRILEKMESDASAVFADDAYNAKLIAIQQDKTAEAGGA
jgi:hypothetical protein